MVIVTGGLGFIGSNLIKRLNSENVIIVDEVSEEKLINLKNCKYKKIVGIEDFRKNISNYKNASYIFHEGGISSTTETDSELIKKNNVSFSIDLINFAVENNIPISYASSASVYGESKSFLETDTLDPRSLYASSKADIDNHVLNLLNKFPNALIQGYRYFNVYGRNESHKKNQSSPIYKFKKNLDDFGFINLFENSNLYFRDFICVDDVVTVKLLMSQKTVNGIFNLGTGVATSFETIANLLISKFGGNIKYCPIPNNLIGQYQMYTCANTDKLLNFIDYKFITVKEYIDQL